jgi:hypothetical protein
MVVTMFVVVVVVFVFVRFVLVIIMLVIVGMVMSVIMLVRMLLVVIVPMFVIMTVIVFVVVLPVPVIMRLGGLIRAAVRLEWRLDMGDLGAQSAHHVFEHMIAADAQAVGQHFHMHMPVAEVIGGTRQLPGIGAAHFGEFFRRRDDLDQPPVFQNQRIAVAERNGVGQVEQKFRAAHACHDDTAAMAAVIVKNDRVARARVPGALGADEIRADHNAFPNSVDLPRAR